jgi:hypothetical protein
VGGDDGLHPVHVAMNGAGVVILENAANLHLVPARGATVYVAVNKVEDGSGSQARVFAIIDEGSASGCATAHALSNLEMASLVLIYCRYLLSN